MGTWVLGAAVISAAATMCAGADIVDNSGSARNGKVGYWSSLVAKAGRVGISYYCETDLNNVPPEAYALRFAWVTGGHEWHWVTVDPCGGSDTSMAMGSNGFYQILYMSCDGMGWATGSDANWSVASVPLSAGVMPSNISMALDQHDRPHVAFMNWSNGGDRSLRYMHFDGTEWIKGSTEVVAVNIWTPTIGFSSTYLALDSAGTPHLTYAVPSDPINAAGDIRYARLEGGQWIRESLNTVGVDPTLRVGRDGIPRIAFLQGDGVMFAYKSGSGWVFENVAQGVPGVSNLGSLSLALSDTDVPSVSFKMSVNEDLYIATRTGTGWDVTMVDGDGQSNGNLILGRYGTGLDVDADGVPHVSYAAIEFYGTTWRTDLRYSGPGGGGPPPCIGISRSPSPVAVCPGEGASFTVVATGSGPLSYLWRWQPDGTTYWLDVVEGTNVDPRTQVPAFVAAGASTATLDLPGDGIARGLACLFRCVVSAECGSATSQSAALTSSTGPSILAHPEDVQTCREGRATFAVEAVGAETYRWQAYDHSVNGWLDVVEGDNEFPASIYFTASGTSSSALVLRKFYDDDQPAHWFSGSVPIRCVVSSPCGDTTSNVATLTVCAADFNCDGQVDFFDYLDFVQVYSEEDSDADFNLDGQIDFFDYLDFVNEFAGGCI